MSTYTQELEVRALIRKELSDLGVFTMKSILDMTDKQLMEMNELLKCQISLLRLRNGIRNGSICDFNGIDASLADALSEKIESIIKAKWDEVPDIRNLTIGKEADRKEG